MRSAALWLGAGAYYARSKGYNVLVGIFASPIVIALLPDRELEERRLRERREAKRRAPVGPS